MLEQRTISDTLQKLKSESRSSHVAGKYGHGKSIQHSSGCHEIQA
jgi:hypothetical protein